MMLTLVWLSTLVVALVNCESYNNPAETSDTSLNYRLPNETYPELYILTLKIHAHTGEKAFQGKLKIDIVVRNDTKSITLHAGRDIKISNACIWNQSTRYSEELAHEYEEKREFLKLTRKHKKTFSSGSKWTLVICYSGKLSDDGKGLALKKYFDDDGKEHYYVESNFESTYARRAFPCYDEPNQRTSFDITLLHSENYTAISKTIADETLSSKGETVFLETNPIPTYAVEIFVSDLVNKKTEVLNNTRHSYYYPDGMEFKINPKANITSMVIKYFSEYTGLQYSNGQIPPQFHYLPLMDDGSVSKNWGLDNEIDAFVESISKHIFTNYITLQWWTHVWLKNGLLTLFRKKALDNIYPEWHVLENFQRDSYGNVLNADGRALTTPLSLYVQRPDEIEKVKYFPTTGHRAALVLMMWSHALTEEVFQKGIQNFLKHSHYNAVTEDDFFAAIQNATEEKNYRIPATIRQMMSTWTQQGGYPLLTITRNYTDGTFSVEQEPYRSNKTAKDKSWYVPINYATATNHNFSDTKATDYLLNEAEKQVKLDIRSYDWLLVNKQLTGLYRIKYDEENYRLLTKALTAKGPFKIPARNRAQLLDDAFSLCFSNRLNHPILLNMLTYLKKEDDYLPWAKAELIIKKYYHYLSDEGDFKWFATELLRPIIKKLNANEVNFPEYERILLLGTACLVGVSECLDRANNKLEAIINGTVAVDYFFRWKTYCDGLRQSSDEQFDFFYQKLLTTTDAEERKDLMLGLRCSRNEKHITTFLSASIDYSNKLNSEDRAKLLKRADKSNKVASLILIEFLKTNWQAIANFTDTNTLSELILQISKNVISQEVNEALLDLVRKIGVSAKADLEANVEKNIANNFKWLEEHRQPIISLIRTYRDQIEYYSIIST